MKNYEKLNIEEKLKNGSESSSKVMKETTFNSKMKTIQTVQGPLYPFYQVNEFNTLKLPQVDISLIVIDKI